MASGTPRRPSLSQWKRMAPAARLRGHAAAEHRRALRWHQGREESHGDSAKLASEIEISQILRNFQSAFAVRLRLGGDAAADAFSGPVGASVFCASMTTPLQRTVMMSMARIR